MLDERKVTSAVRPNAFGDRPRPAVWPSRGPLKSFPSQKILVVDDELWAALDMEWVVRKLGHEVIGPAATAEEAIRLAAEFAPDLALMDIRLAGGSDGIEAAGVLRERFDIPCIFVSAHGDLATRSRAASAEPCSFIEKPFTPEALAAAIEAALDPMQGG